MYNCPNFLLQLTLFYDENAMQFANYTLVHILSYVIIKSDM